MNNTIRATVDKMMEEHFEVPKEKLKPDSKLKEDLGLDSLDFIDMLIYLEKQSGKKIDKVNLGEIVVLEDVYKMAENIYESKNTTP